MLYHLKYFIPDSRQLMTTCFGIGHKFYNVHILCCCTGEEQQHRVGNQCHFHSGINVLMFICKKQFTEFFYLRMC